jgi:hypothetical protein
MTEDPEPTIQMWLLLGTATLTINNTTFSLHTTTLSQNAAPKLRKPGSSALAAVAPPRPAACLDSPPVALTSASSSAVATTARWIWLRRCSRGSSRTPKLHAAKLLWRIHERFNGADGLPGWQDRCTRRPRVYGAKCLHSTHSLENTITNTTTIDKPLP